MAKGRKATPKRTLEKRGSWRAKTKLDDPEGIVGMPEKPDWLSRKAGLEWDRLMPLILETEVTTKIDGNALARYCTLMANYVSAEEMAQDYMVQHTVRDPEDLKQLANFLRANNSLADQLLKLESHFGLTPSARSSLNTIRKDKPDAGDGKPELVRRPG